MGKPLMIGITGGIGSGKSIVCKVFSSLGIPIYDADSRAKKLMTTDGILISQIKKEFGDLSYQEGGALNREFLSRTVFNDEERLQKLNGLVHPRVAEDSAKWMRSNTNYPYLIKEAALLFESGSYQALDRIIVVSAPEEVRVQRVLKRDRNRTESDIRKIIRNQLSEEEKINRADYVIQNDETVLVIPQVLKLHEQFIS